MTDFVVKHPRYGLMDALVTPLSTKVSYFSPALRMPSR